MDPSVPPPEKIQGFIKVFSALFSDCEGGTKMNSLVAPIFKRHLKWLPQPTGLHILDKTTRDLPNARVKYHPNVKLFITQGGLQSTDEAISAGIPVIGVPFLGDQWYNAEHYVYHGVGLQLNIQTLDAETVKNAVEKVIGDPSYRQNMLNIRDLIRDEPMSPLERAVWWTEHVLRHGGAQHLRAPAANMPWTEYYELDLVLLVLGAALALLEGRGARGAR